MGADGSTQSLPCHTASGDNCTSSICPNTVVTYTCTISGTAAGVTDWTLPTGTCTNNTYTDKIRLSQFVSFGQCAAQGSGVPSMCGPYRASSIQPSSGTNCLSSILTVNITAAMNGSTVMCNNYDFMSSASTIVSMATINVVVTYTCTISGTAAGLTDWTLPTGTCPTNTYTDKIRLSQFVCFGQCAAQGSGIPSFATSDEAWCQAQLGLNSGGLGLCSLFLYSSSAYIASVCSAGVVDSEDIHLTNAIDHFNSHVSSIEILSVNSIISSPVRQKLLSSKVNDHCFQNLFDRSSPANKARLLSVSAPSTSQGLHLDPIEFRVAVKGWIPPRALITTCRYSVAELEPWRPVALDISVVSLLNPSTLAEAGATFGAVLEATESRKHQANDEKCSALGWVSTPLAVDSYGAWGPPGRPNVVANTTGSDMVLVVVNPSSSGGLPTSYSVTISNSSYVYSNSTPAFLNWSAMVTFTGLTNSTNYTISAVAINCAGSRPAPTPSPQTSSASIISPTSAATAAICVPSIDVSTAVGITFSITFIMAFSLGVLVTICISCISKTRSKTTSPHPSTPNAPYEMVDINQKKIDVIPLENNDAYGTVK
eukprot:Em0006g445a